MHLLRVRIAHACPNGSSTTPCRSPQNASLIGTTGAAPAATALANRSSASPTYRHSDDETAPV